MQGVGRLHPVGRLGNMLHHCIGGMQLSSAAVPPSPPKAGHYIPLLAQAILDYNSGLPEGAQKLDLQGYAVGNAWTDPSLDNAGVGAAARAGREYAASIWCCASWFEGRVARAFCSLLSFFLSAEPAPTPCPVRGSLHLTFPPPRLRHA